MSLAAKLSFHALETNNYSSISTIQCNIWLVSLRSPCLNVKSQGSQGTLCNTLLAPLKCLEQSNFSSCWTQLLLEGIFKAHVFTQPAAPAPSCWQTTRTLDGELTQKMLPLLHYVLNLYFLGRFNPAKSFLLTECLQECYQVLAYSGRHLSGRYFHYPGTNKVLLKLKINVKVKIFSRKGTFSFMIAAYLVILIEEVR